MVCKNRLSLNIKKCHQISFAKLQNPIRTSYSICSTILDTVNEIKDLGVYFDAKFSFVTHINYTISKAFSMLAFVRRNSSSFSDPYTFKILYSSYVRSILDYAVFIWRPYHQIHINRLESVQKVFIRFALRSLHFSEPLPAYYSRCQLINLMTLYNRRIFYQSHFCSI